MRLISNQRLIEHNRHVYRLHDTSFESIDI